MSSKYRTDFEKDWHSSGRDQSRLSLISCSTAVVRSRRSPNVVAIIMISSRQVETAKISDMMEFIRLSGFISKRLTIVLK